MYKQMLLPVSPWVRPTPYYNDVDPRHNLGDVRGLVVHWPDAPGWGLQELYEYLKRQASGGRYGSYHFGVGPLDRITWNVAYDTWQLIPTDEMAYHVGSTYYTPWGRRKLGNYPNRHSIGVCVCHRSKQGKPDKPTEHQLVRLLANLCEARGLDPWEDIVIHNWVTAQRGKHGPCHRWYFEHGLDNLKATVRGYIEHMKAGRGNHGLLNRELFTDPGEV